MRAILQRVSSARVVVEGETTASIGHGWAILLGIAPEDDEKTVAGFVDRVVNLRAFEDKAGKMNLSAHEVAAEFLVVSQFTLYADLSRGRRPSFVGAASPDRAAPLVDYFVALLKAAGFTVATGRFGTLMDLQLTNHGPVTIVLSTDGWS